MLSNEEMAKIMEEAEYNNAGDCTSVEFIRRDARHSNWELTQRPTWNWDMYEYRYSIPMRRKHYPRSRENRLMADVMRAARYSTNGGCLNIESRARTEDDWRIAVFFNWNWHMFDYRVIIDGHNEYTPTPELIPMDYDDMVKRIKERKDMHVMHTLNEDISVVERIVKKKHHGWHSEVIIGGQVAISFEDLAEQYVWVDTGLPCVKPTE